MAEHSREGEDVGRKVPDGGETDCPPEVGAAERDFVAFFRDATGFDRPYRWQICAAIEGLPELLPVSTGLGKTEGAVLAWAWRRLRIGCPDEPLHLVYCLPMRSLVRQTVERIRSWFGRLASTQTKLPNVPVFELMGGSIDEKWEGCPDRPWVLVGTQDLLLSRALNRGYAMDRFRWPVHFGLLNQDCRWIVDEVQLMGPGLWTTAQLDWMRSKRFAGLKPCRTTWMSATLGTEFLQTTDRKHDGCDTAKPFEPGLESVSNKEHVRRRAARRPIKIHQPATGKRVRPVPEQIASEAQAAHLPGTLTLIVCNTIKTAQVIFQSLAAGETKKILLTSHFRASDRRGAEKKLQTFESRRAASSTGRVEGFDAGLICVSTQVVEAGLDISAHRLWTEHSPWPSVVQRLGRLNRDGKDNEARAAVWRLPKDKHKHEGEDWIGPYRETELDRAQSLLEALAPLSEQKTAVDALAELQAQKPEEYARALAIPPQPCPRALDVHGLFSTEPDLHGGFTDVSRFVRNADPDADVMVFWRDWPKSAPPRGDALDGPPLDPNTEACPVVLWSLQKFLKDAGARAWLWNDRAEHWDSIPGGDLKPGMTVMLRADVGGYSQALGWTGVPSDHLDGLPLPGRGRTLRDDKRSEADFWLDLRSHLADARCEAERLCDALGLQDPVRKGVVEAAGHHDLGKAHPDWRGAIPEGSPLGCDPLAKFPKVLRVAVSSERSEQVRTAIKPALGTADALPDEVVDGGKVVRLRWALEHPLDRTALKEIRALAGVRRAAHQAFRPGLRHEAASALAMWRQYMIANEAPYPALAVYLTAAHHGKVRTVLRAISREGGDVFGVCRTPEAVQFCGRRWPMDFSVAFDGAEGEWTDAGFAVAGPGWTGIVADLLGPWRGEADAAWTGAVPKHEARALGPFALAWLEALVRVADWRASERPSRRVPLGAGG